MSLSTRADQLPDTDDESVADVEQEEPAGTDTERAVTEDDKPEEDKSEQDEPEGERPGDDQPEKPVESEEPAGPEKPVTPRSGWRAKYPVAARTLAWTTSLLAAGLIFFTLLVPVRADYIEPSVFLRIPVEMILGAALLIVLPRKPRLVAAVCVGVSLALLMIMKLFDIGFNMFLGRGFNLVLDWGLLDDAESYLEDSVGGGGALAAVIGAVVLVLAVLAVMTLAVVRLANLMARNKDTATRATVIAGTVWIVCSALGLQVVGDKAFATRNTVGYVQGRVARVQDTLKDEAAFAAQAKKDVFGDVPPDQLLTALRGKDVIFAFIESYGRSALEDPEIAPGVEETLDDATERLGKEGYSAKSGWLTSATYGGNSWLGHSTFLSGLWIDNTQRYRTVTAGERLTLPGAFKRTGAWRTAGLMPGVQKNWPEGDFYGLDQVYDARDLGYKGPKFSWSTMPDQYALEAFHQREQAKKGDKPLVSQLILTSSHQPWAPLPKMLDWDDLGDGSVYKDIANAGKNPSDVFSDSTVAKQEYGKSVEYSIQSLIEYVVRYGSEDTVLVFLGDHQPMAQVSGNGADHDVPVTVVANDPDVLDRISDWKWSDGMRPKADAPVWRMDRFRNRFLRAYGPQGDAGPAPSASASPATR
ncbi:sulfatase [Streptomyces sp. NPDC002845]